MNRHMDTIPCTHPGEQSNPQLLTPNGRVKNGKKTRLTIWNRRIGGVGRDLWGSPSPASLLQQVPHSRLQRNTSRWVFNSSRCGHTRAKGRTSLTLLVTLFVMHPGHHQPSWPRGHTVGNCWPPLQSSFPAAQPPACTDVSSYSSPHVGLYTCSC